ncbi:MULTISPECIES: RNA polymerase sigma factor [Gordonia]|uniref:DNA-directed RNA polymerase subunit sigma n=2 Tax=Gordonia alkanivorans TaxID=84096 RepID=W9DKC7_9ACTN|nr:MULTISPECIES: sigma-70 family RNA polymerase sigma factor [Gordonia]AZZ81038.1 RNA polymerase subunit sigma [Gordonia alkanivorans]ETA07080.1 DNA-directed RNA polymerase subunit sigma [Gordonia alkanivorans CGMCC 6845]MDH3008944.1 sigma-70 family RNA polymerase sigma factor [Gordonia alkanivorans]MDH3012459.1 sigma-70 family RNA polymerase sigma factor [Gordonia alkanivorans]MDH3017905.1 sigma-70 family RNA polymerase sigma factor [Gordonia alkanivorans]
MYREHVAGVWRYVRTRVPGDADADDVTAEVFAKAIRSRGGFDDRRGTIGGWLIGIARHVVADWWARNAREVPVAEVDVDIDRRGAAADDPETAMLRAADVEDVRSRLWVLTAREREAVTLRFATELTSEEIGAAMGISATAARMLVYRGVAKLREVMPQ